MFEDIRREAFEMAKAARAGQLDPNRAMAAAACLKVMNDTFQLELAFRKLGVEVSPAPVLEHQPATIDVSALSAAMDSPDPPKEQPKRRPPNILIMGMRPAEVGRVAEKLNGTADLASWTHDDGHLVLRSLGKRADLVVVATGGIVHHGDTHAIEADGRTIVKTRNSAPAVIAAIREHFTRT